MSELKERAFIVKIRETEKGLFIDCFSVGQVLLSDVMFAMVEMLFIANDDFHEKILNGVGDIARKRKENSKTESMSISFQDKK